MLVSLYFQHRIFRPHWPLPIALIVWGLWPSCFWRLKICLPLFGLCLLWPNGWVDQDATWYGVTPRPRRHCVWWGPSSLLHTQRGTAVPSTFWPTYLVRIPAGPHFTHNPHCRLGSMRRASLVAILSDNCQPFTYLSTQLDAYAYTSYTIRVHTYVTVKNNVYAYRTQN